MRRGLPQRAAWALCAIASLTSLGLIGPVNFGHAQQSEEIFDPELASDDGAAESGSPVEVIEDPELAGAAQSAPAPLALPSEIRAVLHTRLGRDLVVEDPREEVWESQSLIQLEAKLRADESTRFGLGMRLRYWAASMERSAPTAGAMRYAIDLVPMAAYLDRTIAAGFHLRLGYQSVQLGRFDALSSTDVLSVVDLRDGPTTLPDASRVGQLAARIDADLSSSFGLQFIWVPFFSSHILQIAEGDYSFQNAIAGAGNADFEAQFAQVLNGQDTVLSNVRERLTRGGRAKLASAGLDIFSPDPDIKTSQGAVRAVVHGPSGELAFTAATALEKIPVLHVTSLPATQGEAPQDGTAVGGLYAPWVEYPRFYLLALDGATDVGPIQVGAEVSIGLGRSFYFDDSRVVGEQTLHYRGQLLQGSVRAEYLGGQSLVLALEANMGAAVTVPQSALNGFLGLHDGRYQFGLVGLARYVPGDVGVELAAALLTGTTYYVMPRVFYMLTDSVEVELGAHIFGAVARTVQGGPAFGGQGLSAGDLFDGIDQAFFGMRWVPVF